jgi:hypothetical protein
LAAVGVCDANACACAFGLSNDDFIGGYDAVGREKISAGESAQQAAVCLRHEVNAGNVSTTDPIAFAGKTLEARILAACPCGRRVAARTFATRARLSPVGRGGGTARHQ